MTVKNDVLLLGKVFFLLLFFKSGCRSQEVGSPCTVKITNKPGICKISRDCPPVEKQAQQGISPTICSFRQLIIIVCCENPISPSPNEQLANGGGGGDEGAILFPSEEPPNLSKTPFFGGPVRKSEEKCLEYTKAVTDVVYAIPLITEIQPISINVPKCKYNSVTLIVGGAQARTGEFPFMALIGFPNDEGLPDWRCGGTLISDKWVLTAARCTFSRSSEAKWVRLGESDLSRTDESEHKDYEIGEIKIHPEYKHPQKYNDIALVSTTITVTFTKFIRPACLNTKTIIKQRVATATGWGQTGFSERPSNTLLKVQLNIYDKKECVGAYIDENKLPLGIVDTMLCAGELKGGVDTCLGDSGGPLFIREEGNMCKFYVVGVTSFGKLCGLVNTPGIYTKVSEYVSWIENEIW